MQAVFGLYGVNLQSFGHGSDKVNVVFASLSINDVLCIYNLRIIKYRYQNPVIQYTSLRFGFVIEGSNDKQNGSYRVVRSEIMPS